MAGMKLLGLTGGRGVGGERRKRVVGYEMTGKSGRGRSCWALHCSQKLNTGFHCGEPLKRF